MTATAVLTLHDNVAVVINGISMLAGDKVYDEGRLAEATGFPYAVMGAWTEPEDSGRYYGQPGAEQTGQIRWWGVDKDEAMRAFAAGKAALDGVTLTMTGHKAIKSSLGYITDFPEPSITESPPHCVVSRLRTRTVET